MQQPKQILLLGLSPQHWRTFLGDTKINEIGGYPVAPGLQDFLSSGEASPKFLAELTAAPSSDPWKHGFAIVHLESKKIIGLAGFKGPPGGGRTVEISYGIVPGYEGKGHGTEAAMSLTDYAFASGLVDRVCAHTLPQTNGSTRILEKSGFKNVGEVVDPEDGLVWRWEKGK